MLRTIRVCLRRRTVFDTCQYVESDDWCVVTCIHAHRDASPQKGKDHRYREVVAHRGRTEEFKDGAGADTLAVCSSVFSVPVLDIPASINGKHRHQESPLALGPGYMSSFRWRKFSLSVVINYCLYSNLWMGEALSPLNLRPSQQT